MGNSKLKEKLIKIYQNMNKAIYEDDSKWSVEELAGYFLYNISSNEEMKKEFMNVKKEIPVRQMAWKLIKKALYPFTYIAR